MKTKIIVLSIVVLLIASMATAIYMSRTSSAIFVLKIDSSATASSVGWPAEATGNLWVVGRRDVHIIFPNRDPIESNGASVIISRTVDGRINSVYVEPPAVSASSLIPTARAAIGYAFGKDEMEMNKAQENLRTLQGRLGTNPPMGSVPLGRSKGYPCVSVIVSPSQDDKLPWLVKFVVDNP